MGNDILNTFIGLFNAITFFVKSAISFITSSPWLLGFVVIVLLTAGSGVSVGRRGISLRGRR